MSERVLHILKCAVATDPMPPAPELPQDLAEYDETNWTIQLLYSWFPDAQAEHALHDLHSKRKKHTMKRGGRTVRRKADTVMKEDGIFHLHQEHVVEYAAEHEADYQIIYGSETHDTFVKFFNGLKKQWGIYEDVMVGTKLVCLYFTGFDTPC